MPGSRPTERRGRTAVAASTAALTLVAGIFEAAAGAAPASPPEGAVAPAGIASLDFKLQDAANYQMLVTNWGMLGSQPGTGQPFASQPSLQWPAASGIEYLWSGGLWVGAETTAGPRVSTTQYTTEFAPSSTNEAHIYTTHEGALGGHRLPAPDADDDHDGRIDEDRLNGLDDDGDGLADEDFAGISDQMYFCEYFDGLVTRAQHVPLGLRVEQTTLAWADTSADDIVGIDYGIVNVEEPAAEPLLGLYAGLFADCDIGPRDMPQYSADDRAGFWDGAVNTMWNDAQRTVKVSIGYMFDADGDAGRTPGWIGLVVLGGSRAEETEPPLPPVGLVNFRFFSGSAAYANGGDPTDDAERYAVLEALDPRPLPPPDPVSGYRPSQLAPRADDYRMVISAGPLGRLAPGQVAHVQFAIVLGAGFEALLQNAAHAVLLYENGWRLRPPVGVALRDLEASAVPGAVQLAWRVDPGALGGLHGVSVQRAATAVGPYADVTASPLAPAGAMGYEDRSVVAGGTYWYRLLVLAAAGSSVYGPVRIDVPRSATWSTALGVPVQEPDGRVRIPYTLLQPGAATLDVFDLRGARLQRFSGTIATAGAHSCWWDRRDARGRRVARGIYFVRLTSGGRTVSAKLLVARD